MVESGSPRIPLQIYYEPFSLPFLSPWMEPSLPLARLGRHCSSHTTVIVNCHRQAVPLGCQSSCREVFVSFASKDFRSTFWIQGFRIFWIFLDPEVFVSLGIFGKISKRFSYLFVRQYDVTLRHPPSPQNTFYSCHSYLRRTGYNIVK